MSSPFPCDEARLLLSLLPDLTPGDEELESLGRHLGSCADCRQQGVRFFRQDRALLELTGRRSLPELARRLREGLAAEPAGVGGHSGDRRQLSRGWAVPRQAWLVAGLSACFLAALLVFRLIPKDPIPRGSEPSRNDYAARPQGPQPFAPLAPPKRTDPPSRTEMPETPKGVQKTDALPPGRNLERVPEEARKPIPEIPKDSEPKTTPVPKRESPEPGPLLPAERENPSSPPVTVSSVARLEKCLFGGEVWTTRGIQRRPADVGIELGSGEGLEVGKSSLAIVRLPDGTRLEIWEGTLLISIRRVDAPGQGPRGLRIEILEGVVTATVSKQPTGQSMVFACPSGEARVLGTSLGISVSRDPKVGMRLEVGEGKVEFWNAAGRSVLVEGGHYAIAAAGTELRALLRSQDPKKGRKKKLTPEEQKINAAIERGMTYLLKTSVPELGAAPRQSQNEELVLWALLHAGLLESDPVFQKLLGAALGYPIERTYQAAHLAMCLEAIDRVKYQAKIAECAQFLVDNQCANGQWNYGEPTPFGRGIPTGPTRKAPSGTGPKGADLSLPIPEREKPKVLTQIPIQKRGQGPAIGDFSNSQYAALGLRACHDAGIVVPQEVFAHARDSWIKLEMADGGWSYEAVGSTYMSMTAGGVGSLAIYDFLLGKPWMKDAPVLSGIKWMGLHFDPSKNTGYDRELAVSKNGWLYYGLYGVERAATFVGTSRFGDHDWYSEGAKYLLGAQNADGSWSSDDPSVNTCWAILFLRRATRALVDVATVDRYMDRPHDK